MAVRSRCWQLCLGGLILLLLPALGGCAVMLVGAGAGTVAYLQGEHSQVHAGNYDRV
jgi:hypothetical protein